MYRLYSLRMRLLLLVFLALLPGLALILFTGLEQRQSAAMEARSDALRVARVAADQQENEIRLARQLLTTISRIVLARGTDAAGCETLFAELLRQDLHYSSLHVIRPDGTVGCNAPPEDQTPDSEQSALVQRTFETRALQMGRYHIDRAAGRAELPFAEAVVNDRGQVQAVVLLALNLDWFQEMPAVAQLPSNSVFAAIAADGTVLAYYPDSDKWTGKTMPDAPAIHAALISQQGSSVETSGIDGIPRVYVSAPLGTQMDTGAFVSIGIPTSYIYAQQDRMLFRNLLLLALVTAMALAAAWVFGNVFIVDRVDALLQATRRLAAGDLSARIRIRSEAGELSQLARAFDQMADSLERHQRELERAESKYRTLVEQIPAVTYIASLDEKSSALYVSPQIQALLGYTPEEWLADPSIWTNRIHPDDRNSVLAQLAESRSNGRPFRSEYRLIAHGDEVVWVRDQGVIVCGEKQEPLFMQGVLVDISELKRAEGELQKLYSEMEQRVRDRTAQLEAANKELEAFSYSVSHDLRAPLSAADGFLHLVADEGKGRLGADGERFLHLALDNLAEMKQLIEDLLLFSRSSRQPLKKETVQPSEIARQAMETLGNQNRRQVEVEIDEMDSCSADPVLLKQVFVNLLSNALKFTRERPIARIQVGSKRELGERVFFVKDNGVGFDMSQADRLFGAFQRLHRAEEYEGSGIGLAIVERIITRHGGRVWAVSQVDHGAVFYFALPE